MATLRVAVVQAGSIPFDRDASIAKAVTLMQAAADQGAKLIVFPEAFIGGYPKGVDFGARVGSRTAEGRAFFRRYFEGAIEVPGPTLARVAEACRMHQVHLVLPVIEQSGGTLYCTVLFFSPSGELLGKRRKLMPTAMERLIWGCGQWADHCVLQTPIGRIGAAICWENYMPLLRTALYAKGIQLYCAPTVDDRQSWTHTVQHIACEGRCFVLSANQFIRRGAFPADYPAIQGDDPDTVLIGGGSVIVDPFGTILAGPDRAGESILTADLDLDQLIEGKFDLDVVGHYSRPDIFRLTVNGEPISG